MSKYKQLCRESANGSLNFYQGCLEKHEDHKVPYPPYLNTRALGRVSLALLRKDTSVSFNEILHRSSPYVFSLVVGEGYQLVYLCVSLRERRCTPRRYLLCTIPHLPVHVEPNYLSAGDWKSGHIRQ